MVKQVIPKNLDEALELLKTDNYILVSGGTDLMVQNYSESGLPPDFSRSVMYISNLAELKQIKADKDDIVIGAETTLEEIRKSRSVPSILRNIIGEMASPGIRNIGTLAGNIGNASPAGDALVGLYLLNASVELKNKTGSRIIPIEKYITGPRKTLRQPDEMIIATRMPREEHQNQHYRKVGPRRANAISKLSFGAICDFEKNMVKDIRIAFGAVAPVVVRDKPYEQSLLNLSKAELKVRKKEIISHYLSLVVPIDDQRSTAVYRKKTAMALLKEYIDLITD